MIVAITINITAANKSITMFQVRVRIANIVLIIKV